MICPKKINIEIELSQL